MCVLAAHAENIGASLQFAGRDFCLAETDDGGIRLSCVRQNFSSGTARGPHQRENAALAAACLFDLAAKPITITRPDPTGKCVFQQHSIGCMARAGAATT